MAEPVAYATVMAVLLVLFLARVFGQILAATVAPSWLPPMARWYSGLMPYRYLLPTQIVFLVVMMAMTLRSTALTLTTAIANTAPPVATTANIGSPPSARRMSRHTAPTQPSSTIDPSAPMNPAQRIWSRWSTRNSATFSLTSGSHSRSPTETTINNESL